MAIYGCTVEVIGANSMLTGHRGLSSVTRMDVGTYRVTIDPMVHLAANEFTASATLRDFPVPANSVLNPIVYKQLVNQNELYVLVTLDNTLVDCSFDLIVETYRS